MCNFFAGPFITDNYKAEQKVAISFTAFVSMKYYLILNLFLLLPTILSLFLLTIIIKSNVKTLEGKKTLVEREVGLATILGIIN